MGLEDYINTHHEGNKAAFARSMNTIPQTVTRWVNDGFIVVDGVLYSPRREILNLTEND